ncbi:amidohydrolase family protein [Desulfogranum mediterraneum]|uniref:amidohydrolase family protein n=1 Tax=Desulfogranum mediterraneum TaxID=160661 RepID=UPI0003F5D935|nr:amidohydrolase family protein [Desulfogranum mediterraneum]
MSPVTIHQAPWVFPVGSPPLEQAGLAIRDGKILALGAEESLRAAYPAAALVAHPQSVLTPALVNAHIHLELSHLGELSAGEVLPSSFTAWVSSLIRLRDRVGATGAAVEEAAAATVLQQYASGVSVLADIGNTGVGQATVPAFNGRLYPFKEYLGFSSRGLDHNLARLEQEPAQVSCSAHAVYSTHADLLKALKTRAAHKGEILPIHVAEPLAEIEMIRRGRGEMVEFLSRRGFWEPVFPQQQPDPAQGTIAYLHGLGLLDSETLCVHAVHVEAEEIKLLVESGAKVCLCPGSNRFLQVGQAPVGAYLEAGLLPALGTDSVASNPELSLWREMQLLHQDHPALDPLDIFAMATLGGAQALGLEDRLGTLAPGCEADILAVPLPAALAGGKAAGTPAEVARYLVSGGSSICPVRIYN